MTVIKQAEVIRKNGEKVTITMYDLGADGPVNRWKLVTSYEGGSFSRTQKAAEKKFNRCVKHFSTH